MPIFQSSNMSPSIFEPSLMSSGIFAAGVSASPSGEASLLADFIGREYRTGEDSSVSTSSDLITHSATTLSTMTDGYGDELISNGDFDSDIAGWTAANGTASWVGGQILLTEDAVDGTSARVSQAITTVVGTAYWVTAKVGDVSTGTGIVAASDSTAIGGKPQVGSSGNETVSFAFVAEATTTYIVLAVSGTTARTVYFDNVSVKEMPVIKWAPHNLLPYSEQFDNAAWAKTGTVTVTANAATAPDGSETADRVVTSGASAITQSVVQEINHTINVWVKAVTVGSNNTFRLQGTGGQLSSNFTATGDWQLFSFTPTTLGTNDKWGINRDSSNNAMDLYVWGAHLYRSDLGGMVDNPDQPPSRSSYVPTTTAAKYLPRIGHHVYTGSSAWANEGLLAESEARTNLAPTSDMSTAILTGGTRTANAAISPDGTENAFKLESNTSSSSYLGFDGVLTSGQSYAVSIYAKAGNNDIIRIGNISSGTSAQWFDLTNGTLLTSNGANNTATIQDVGNGWYRCTRYFDSVTTSGTPQVFVANSDADNSTNSVSGEYVYLYGFQIENNATSSSFIPTSGSSVTRAAESFTIPSANLPWPEPVYTGSELVINGGFDDTSQWGSIAAGCDISGGTFNTDGTSTGELARDVSIGITAGKVYKASYEITARSAGELGIKIGGGQTSRRATTGVFSFIFVADATMASANNVQISSVNGIGSIDNISVREVNPLSVSIAMDGRMTYADEDSLNVFMFDWRQTGTDYIQHRLDTRGSDTGQFQALQVASGTADSDSSGSTLYSPDVFVPFSVAGRHGSTFVAAAADGVTYGANTTPTALPDLSATDLDLAHVYMGTIGTFRVWDKDITDDGLVEATNPSLEPSLSLTFEGTGTNSFVVNDWSE